MTKNTNTPPRPHRILNLILTDIANARDYSLNKACALAGEWIADAKNKGVPKQYKRKAYHSSTVRRWANGNDIPNAGVEKAIGWVFSDMMKPPKERFYCQTTFDNKADQDYARSHSTDERRRRLLASAFMIPSEFSGIRAEEVRKRIEELKAIEKRVGGKE